MRQLVLPTTRLHASWLSARDEWGRGVHQPGAALWRAVDCDLDSEEGFTTWVTRLRGDADPSTPLPDGLVHATTWWIVHDDSYLGAIQLRHHLNEHLLASGGHIGYGIRPSARRRGHATWALGRRRHPRRGQTALLDQLVALAPAPRSRRLTFRRARAVARGLPLPPPAAGP